MQESILVLSSSVGLAGLIARTLRYRQVYCTPVPPTTPMSELLAKNPRGIILASPEGKEDIVSTIDPEILTSSLPVLALGGAVISLCRYFGGSNDELWTSNAALVLNLIPDPLFDQIASGERILHDICALSLPDALLPLADASDAVIGFKHSTLPIYAMQYPIERNDPDSAQLLYNFASEICKLHSKWEEDVIIDNAVDLIRDISGAGQVVCAVSGGVDSAVCAKLASLAVSDRLTCIFVDTGLFRLNETTSVINSFKEDMGIKVIYVDAKESFLNALSGVTSASDKKRITSSLMTQILLKQFTPQEHIPTLLMGTNLNDTLKGEINPITKASSEAELIICEPLLQVLKEEIRWLATTLGLPAVITERKPFPLSGLALRIAGVVTTERLDVLRAAEDCFMGEIRHGGHQKRLWQYYVSLAEDPESPKSYIIYLRALQAAQGGKYAARLPFDLLERVTSLILSKVHGISRVVYDLTPSHEENLQE